MVIVPNGPIDVDWLGEQIESLHLEYDEESARNLQRYPYDLTQTRRHFSWGADSQTVQFLIETAATFGRDGLIAAGGAGATLLLEQGWQKLYDQLKARGHDVRYGRIATLSDDEAESRGRWLIVSEYAVEYDELMPRAVGRNKADQTYSLTASGPDGAVYNVVFQVRGTSATLLECKKELP
ncbi:hypothetical protein [Nocardia sp. NPDC052316]|uniref:hypothetical protein n=1 Tax=Nocardia sp. NPDC052316 TaxID=3364329 RepID=UPI0037CC8F6F